jgi:hypothetical protein
MKYSLKFAFLLFLPAALTFGEVAVDQESDFYKITTFQTPAETAMEVGSIEVLPGGKLALGTRRGEIWTVANAQGEPVQATYQLFAAGQHEVLGLAYRDGSLFATSRYELLRLQDQSGDGRADVFQTVYDGWGVSGDYHEYNFGSRFDKNGDLWTVLCLTGSFDSKAPFRGWALRIKPDGTMTPTCSGIRSPGGIGFDAEGAVYYTDNQGPWHGSSTLQYLVPGSFQGHPGGNHWYSQAPNMGPEPIKPNDNSRMVTERERIKELVPPAVYLVHGKVGNSPTFIAERYDAGEVWPIHKPTIHRRPEPLQHLPCVSRDRKWCSPGRGVSVLERVQVRPDRRPPDG